LTYHNHPCAVIKSHLPGHGPVPEQRGYVKETEIINKSKRDDGDAHDWIEPVGKTSVSLAAGRSQEGDDEQKDGGCNEENDRGYPDCQRASETFELSRPCWTSSWSLTLQGSVVFWVAPAEPEQTACHEKVEYLPWIAFDIENKRVCILGCGVNHVSQTIVVKRRGRSRGEKAKDGPTTYEEGQ
jgi:hypothetical protein